MKTVIVDDDLVSRSWLRGVVKKLGFAVVAEAADGHEAVAAVARTQPDLVMLDVSMPIQTGPTALPEILKAAPGVRVVMLTSIADECTVMDCLEKGAAGYLRKDSSVQQIQTLLRGLQEETARTNPGATHDTA